MTEAVITAIDDAPIAPHEIDLDQVEAYMLTLPQIDCPVQYHFGPGLCIRERGCPAGSLIVGHKHKFPNMSMIMSGACVVLEDGRLTEIVAPFIFVGEARRKVIYALTDVVWLNILATELTDPAEIEAHFVEPSQAFREAAACL
jgi:hypothetical protein